MFDATPAPGRAETPLFVGGCPRSGTTALTRLLNRHRDVLIGNERFYRVIERGELSPACFEPERFLDLREGDTHDEPPGGVAQGAPGAKDPYWLDVDAVRRLPGAHVLGDKYPPVFRAYPLVAERFAAPRVLYVLREPLSVMESYQDRADDPDDAWHFDAARGLADWNESVGRTRSAMASGLEVVVVAYEDVLFGADAVSRMLAALRLDPDGWENDPGPLLRRGGAERPTPRRTSLRRAVAEQADLDGYRALLRVAVS